jgi:Competence protein CoiA-like family
MAGRHFSSDRGTFDSLSLIGDRPGTVPCCCLAPTRPDAGCWRVSGVGGEDVTDLYVPGLDLCTGRVVEAGERPVWEWRRKGHNGDGTLLCLGCYHGTDWPDGPREVPLVPRGRVGGARQPHFAHPAGMGPPAGHHHPETAWHWEAKQLLCRWARTVGAAAWVEAWTADRRRRSDVSVTLPGGSTLAFEVQYGRITDAEVLARREDYADAGITVIWVWRQAAGIPDVLYRFGDPGWVLDLAAGQLGFVCGTGHSSRARGGGAVPRAHGPHWPPCPSDEIEIRWMPLADVRLTANGFLPSPPILARLEKEAAEAARRAEAEQQTAPRPRTAVVPRPRPAPLRHPERGGRRSRSAAGQASRPHLALRIDALPPWSDPGERMYWCPRCGYLSGAELRSNLVAHEIPGPDRIITREDLDPGP